MNLPIEGAEVNIGTIPARFINGQFVTWMDNEKIYRNVTEWKYRDDYAKKTIEAQAKAIQDLSKALAECQEERDRLEFSLTVSHDI